LLFPVWLFSIPFPLVPACLFDIQLTNTIIFYQPAVLSKCFRSDIQPQCN
jgi:hypothetical protein